MAFAHYVIKQIIHFILHIFWVFPIKKKRIVFLNELSFKYGDNLKYLNEYLKKNCPNEYRVIFPLADKKESQIYGLLYVKPFSIAYFMYLLTSGVIITNAGGISYLPVRKSQLVINTWHGGGPYKKTGGTLFNDKWYQRELQMQRRNTTYMLSSCEYFSKYEAPGMLFESESCISSGMPRNDIFFDNSLSLRKKIFDAFGLKDSEKIILFAPTFRSNSTDFTASKKYHASDLDYDRLLNCFQMKFGGSWKLALRLHPKLKDVLIDVPNALNLTAYPDMQELLYVADVVITDYSSLMWDFSLTGRPCFIYADDIDEYERERGFYMPSCQWPYPIARDNDEMEKNILNFDLLKYQDAVKKHHKESGSYEQGKACETIINLIENYIQ